ncbi:MAG: hypothetical protein AAB778_01125 [Patescibacteria group bacterium]
MIGERQNKLTYGFAISGGRTILYKLKNVDCCYLVSLNNIEHYSRMLIHDQPFRIFGLGFKSNYVYKAIDMKIKELIKSKQLKSKYYFFDTSGKFDYELLDAELE